MTENEILGDRIRQLRKERDMRISQLAEEINKTPSYVSQVERGLAEPSITSLRTIAKALEIPLFYLLLDAPEKKLVVRKRERKVLHLSQSNITYELLTPDLNRKMEIIQFHLEPGAMTCTEPLTHTGEEFNLIMKGMMQIQIGDDLYQLNEGDTIYYPGMAPHKITALGDTELVFLSAITPPKF